MPPQSPLSIHLEQLITVNEGGKKTKLSESEEHNNKDDKIMTMYKNDILIINNEKVAQIHRKPRRQSTHYQYQY